MLGELKKKFATKTQITALERQRPLTEYARGAQQEGRDDGCVGRLVQVPAGGVGGGGNGAPGARPAHLAQGHGEVDEPRAGCCGQRGEVGRAWYR